MVEMSKVIVAGSRSIENKKLVKDTIKESPHTPYNGELVVGDADGVDELAKESLSGFRHVDITEFEADWEEYGKSAGPIRNKEMAKYGDALIAIWDGESSGTKNMIECAIDEGLDVYVKVVEGQGDGVFEY